jgi:hypothetical protein
MKLSHLTFVNLCLLGLLSEVAIAQPTTPTPKPKNTDATAVQPIDAAAPPVVQAVVQTAAQPVVPAAVAPTSTATVQPIVQSPIVAQSPAVEATVAATQGELEIVSPTPSEIIDVGAVNVTVRYPIDAPIELRVNGELVSASLIGRTETDKKAQRITQTWVGVSLKDGTNNITANRVGKPETAVNVPIQVRGDIAKITLSTAESRVPADGRSTITVQGQLLDAQGNRSNRDGLVTLKTAAGEFIEPDADSAQPGYQVKASRGDFQATLRSNLQAQTVRIQAQINQVDAFTQLD